MKNAIGLSGLFLMVALNLAHAADAVSPRTVTFVCEHGVAKSVIAAAHFNRLAAAANLNYRAVARGVAVEPNLQAATVAGLQKDGLDTSGFTPMEVSPDDVKSSAVVVSIGVESEPAYLHTPKLQQWDGVPAVSKNYELARDDLVQRLETLVRELKTQAN